MIFKSVRILRLARPSRETRLGNVVRCGQQRRDDVAQTAGSMPALILDLVMAGLEVVMYASDGKRIKSMPQQAVQDTALAAAKVAPAAFVAATGATGAVDWNNVAYMLTAFYMVLQIVLLVPKYRQMLRDWKDQSGKK